MRLLSLTPCFSGVHQSQSGENRFSCFWHTTETAKAVEALDRLINTPRKRGVNERTTSVRGRANFGSFNRTIAQLGG